MLTAARILNLNCNFEVEGRFDGVVETIIEQEGEKPQIVLFAEWESNYDKKIFDEELEKIWNRLKNNSSADGFLLTYCPTQEYFNFVSGVLQFWQKKPLNTDKQCL